MSDVDPRYYEPGPSQLRLEDNLAEREENKKLKLAVHALEEKLKRARSWTAVAAGAVAILLVFSITLSTTFDSRYNLGFANGVKSVQQKPAASMKNYPCYVIEHSVAEPEPWDPVYIWYCSSDEWTKDCKQVKKDKQFVSYPSFDGMEEFAKDWDLKVCERAN